MSAVRDPSGGRLGLVVSAPWARHQAWAAKDASQESGIRQAWWIPEPACAGAGGVAPTHDAGCDRFSLRLRLDGRLEVDRIYPPAVPIGAGGVLVHTRYLAGLIDPSRTCVELIPPKEGVVIANAESSAQAVCLAPAELGDRYLYFGDAPRVVASHGLKLHVVSSAGQALTNHVQAIVLERAQQLGLPSRGVAELALFVERDASQAGYRWRGDITTGNMVRISFSSAPIDLADPAMRRDIDQFITHELVHLVENPANRSDRSTGPWASEGLAEFLSALIVTGHDVEGFAERLEDGLNRCTVHAGGRESMQLDQITSGAAVYDCGLVAYIAATINMGDADPVVSWTAHAQDGTVAPAIQALLVGVVTTATADGADTPANDTGTPTIGQALSVLRRRAIIGPGHADESKAMQFARMLLREGFKETMAGACGGAYGFRIDHGLITTDAIPGCAPFEQSRQVSSIQGQAIDDPQDVLRSMHSACAAPAPRLRLGTVDGNHFHVPASCAEGGLPAYQHVNAQRVGVWLQKWSARTKRKETSE